MSKGIVSKKGHIVPDHAVPSIDAMTAQAWALSAPALAEFGEASGKEVIDDGWLAPDNALEMDEQNLISAWNAHVQRAKRA